MKNIIKCFGLVFVICCFLFSNNYFSFPNVKSKMIQNPSYSTSDLIIDKSSTDLDNMLLSTNDTNQNENEGHFDFIKSNNVLNNFGDTMIFLYVGVSLIAISVSGILFTLIPRKKSKKRKRASKRKNKH